MKQGKIRIIAWLYCTLFFTLFSGGAYAHAFPVRSSPEVGSTLATAPKSVMIWYDADLNALFTKMTVKNGAGQVVSENSHVSAHDQRKLTALLQPIGPGRYTVYWSAVASDGHHTEGHWPFTVK
ncbi:MAG: copper resistance CopC family protein [Acidithiobacillus sp.]